MSSRLLFSIAKAVHCICCLISVDMIDYYPVFVESSALLNTVVSAKHLFLLYKMLHMLIILAFFVKRIIFENRVCISSVCCMLG